MLSFISFNLNLTLLLPKHLWQQPKHIHSSPFSLNIRPSPKTNSSHTFNTSQLPSQCALKVGSPTLLQHPFSTKTLQFLPPFFFIHFGHHPSSSPNHIQTHYPYLSPSPLWPTKGEPNSIFQFPYHYLNIHCHQLEILRTQNSIQPRYFLSLP